ncbi:TetR/AcrR family transcriptional regulator [Actinoallomurus sp. CA-150999]|uniref:TetR/AcrR family transcriptional regulator n=1 Tax=Actinoallomurus sp. CA-150999 TaxID=3239887 RepID=UPI003D8A4C4B
MSPVSDPAYPSDVRAALLDAAHAELVERGVSGLSLRAIAERAGVSRATPKWHFGDRAGLLTAVAAAGFRRLGEALGTAAADAGPDASARFTALGRAYLRFGLDNPALFDLMFRPDQLHADDPNLQAAQQDSFAVLRQATAGMGGRPQETEASQELALLAWAAAHGLVALVRDGALQAMTGSTVQGTAQLAHSLVDRFTNDMRPPERTG